MTDPGAPPARPDADADVELRLPADGAYVSVLRTTTASLAARLDFTIDDVEDLRIAVGEAASLVIRQADDAAAMTCSFRLARREVTITLTAPSAEPVVPDHDGFAWQVLTTLASRAEVDVAADRFGVRLTMATSVELQGGYPVAPDTHGIDAPALGAT